MKFTGLTDWFEIFKTGTWTDASGNTKNWTVGDLDTIVANFNPNNDEVPIVIGHPKDNDPAWGWVKAIKRVGEVLFAKGKDIVKEFEDMVRNGLFKNRSIRLSPDGTKLRHIGFLGAAAPAVKGLADIKFIEFKEGGNIMYEFSTKSDPGEELSKKAYEIYRNPPAYGGQVKEITFSEAFSIAQRENPELTQAYMEYLFGDR
jgi:hypothetical protein